MDAVLSYALLLVRMEHFSTDNQLQCIFISVHNTTSTIPKEVNPNFPIFSSGLSSTPQRYGNTWDAHGWLYVPGKSVSISPSSSAILTVYLVIEFYKI